jgi:quaternary ammonium compound-resistance protein SugE
MGWLYLLLAVAFEIAWAVSLKSTEGYSRLWPSMANALLALGAMLTLAKAVKGIPIGISYPVWAGLSLIGVVIIGVSILNEYFGFWHLIFVSLIIIGIVGLKALPSA